MEEVSATPAGPLAALLVLLLRLWGISGLETPVALYFGDGMPESRQATSAQVLGFHSVAVLMDRAQPREIQDQCDVELDLPGAELDHRLLCDLPLGGVHHHRLRVLQPGRGHVFLPGPCPKQLQLPRKPFPRLLTAEPAELQGAQAIRARCGPATGVLRRR